jgi:DNA-directed RNA polymerase specialized sigma24 family protein
MPSRSVARRDYGQDSDANPVTPARAGDDEAFTEIIRRRHAKIRHCMRYLSGRAGDGDDLARQASVRAWKGIRKHRATAAFDGWLRRIMVTTWIDKAKERKLTSRAKSTQTRFRRMHGRRMRTSIWSKRSLRYRTAPDSA